MGKISTNVLRALTGALLLAGCAAHHQRDFIPNGAAVDLPPTNPAHIQVLDSIPRGMIIGTVLVDRAKAKDTQGIIEAAREEAAAVGGDFIVWEDSLGTLPVATPTPNGSETQSAESGELGHPTADVVAPADEMTEHRPEARFTVGIFLPEEHGSGNQ